MIPTSFLFVSAQIDIEGAEFEFFEDIFKDKGDSIRQTNQLLFESHQRFLENGSSRIKSVLAGLQEQGFTIASTVLGQEYSLIRD